MNKKRRRSPNTDRDVSRAQQKLRILQKTEEYLTSSDKLFSELSSEKKKEISGIFRTARYHWYRLTTYKKLTKAQEELFGLSCRILSYKRIFRS